MSTPIPQANITQFMAALNVDDVKTLHRWSVEHYQDFWERMVNVLGIVFKTPPVQLCDLSQGIESPNWFPGAQLNIIDSCFKAPADRPAILYQDANKNLCALTYAALDQLSNQVANSLCARHFHANDAIAIIMPMNVEAIAIYLGIIKMGGIVVSIADSFSSQEIATRLSIAKAKAVFTQDNINWNNKSIPLYEKICQASAPPTIVVTTPNTNIVYRSDDCSWHDFLLPNTQFTTTPCHPMAPCNILFSSGTTATPKAIPWNHTSPIKVASDAYFHQNIQPGDVLAWPTNLGWMMGPWLIFAALLNQATIALSLESPKERGFGEFIQQAKVTMLGVVPTLVAAWRHSKCMENLNWKAIKVFSSTGECSNADDMRYLMALAGDKPVIEYCGGTEISGAYITSTVIETNYPAQFSTPAMGLDFIMLDTDGHPSDTGEVAIIPPSLGLSTTLLNADHHRIYFANMPSYQGKPLRRHGDEVKRLPNTYYCLLGRIDDSLNLGGIKTSAADIERAIAGISEIEETAAIAVSPQKTGPSLLVIYAVTHVPLDEQAIKQTMQHQINQRLNPLFKIHQVIFVSALPKTASNKIMRRVLRDQWQ